jgi:hypothetical protein
VTQPQDAANALLMSGGMKSIGWKDNPIGYTVVGTIVDQPRVEQMKKHKSEELQFWPSGDPMMQIVCTIQTDLRDPSDPHDEGKRKLHIPPRMQKPVREAVQRVGAPGLAMGGRIAVRRTGGTGESGSPFEFAAEYASPVVDPGSLLGGNGNGAAPATTQAAPATQAQPAQAAAPAVSPVAQSLGLTSPATPPPAPPGVDPAVWAGLPDTQKAAVLAAMAVPSF